MSEAARKLADAPTRAVRLGPQDVNVERRADGIRAHLAGETPA